MDKRPPKPILALTIGITGHRLLRKPLEDGAPSDHPSIDPTKVRAAIEGVLAFLARAIDEIGEECNDWFAEAPPLIAVVSSLAEGTDRIAARAAIAKTMPLDVVLPFPRARYEATFSTDELRREFATLLEAARATLILPAPGTTAAGDERSLDEAYELAGLTVLAQADILIAVWDGLPGRGRGGTAEIVDEAARQGTPIIVIGPDGGEAHLRWNGGRPFAIAVRHANDLTATPLDAGIPAILLGLIKPPKLEHETHGMRMFLESSVENRMQHFGWKLLRRTMGLGGKKKPPPPPRHVPPQSEADRQPPSASNAAAEARFRAITSAASRIADDFSQAFRSAFVVNFLLGAMAVLFVGLSIVLKSFAYDDRTLRWWHGWLVMGELVCVATVVIYVFIASRQQWHRRWFEAREVAERLRVARPFWRLGVWPHNLAVAQPAWTGWYMRAILREVPVYSGDLGVFLPEAKAILWNLIDGQIDYHRRTIAEMEHLDRTLGIIGLCCLVVTVTAAVVFFIGGVFLFDWELSDRTEAIITALAVFLPALATALYGIRLIGDFEGLVRRSGRTLELLNALNVNLAKGVNDLPELRTCARLAADAMLADVETWRVAVESRNLGAA